MIYTALRVYINSHYDIGINACCKTALGIPCCPIALKVIGEWLLKSQLVPGTFSTSDEHFNHSATVGLPVYVAENCQSSMTYTKYLHFTLSQGGGSPRKPFLSCFKSGFLWHHYFYICL